MTAQLQHHKSQQCPANSDDLILTLRWVPDLIRTDASSCHRWIMMNVLLWGWNESFPLIVIISLFSGALAELCDWYSVVTLTPPKECLSAFYAQIWINTDNNLLLSKVILKLSKACRLRWANFSTLLSKIWSWQVSMMVFLVTHFPCQRSPISKRKVFIHPVKNLNIYWMIGTKCLFVQYFGFMTKCLQNSRHSHQPQLYFVSSVN